jgi:aryl-alcohol dehydrogenase-like predicted oxidoreductase
MHGFSTWARELTGRMSGAQNTAFSQQWHQLWTKLQHLVRTGDGLIRKNWTERARRVRQQFGSLQAPAVQQRSLQECAIAALVNTPGVSSVLVGMRSESYVDQAIAASRLPLQLDWAASTQARTKR